MSASQGVGERQAANVSPVTAGSGVALPSPTRPSSSVTRTAIISTAAMRLKAIV